MRAEVVAIGTELLLGQIVDTNSALIAERLASAGIDCHFQTRVGDNIERIVEALSLALSRSDAVVVCGGLGPTDDDITREAIAKVMGVELARDEEVLAVIEELFARRGRTMVASNARQADVPVGASVIPQRTGTAPGLVCPVGDKVIYAAPGVPFELAEMLERAILPDLKRRSGGPAVIASRTLRTWGLGESELAEVIAPRVAALEVAARSAASTDIAGRGEGLVTTPTIAFLASGIEGIKVRVTVKARDASSAERALRAEEDELRALLGERVFAVDDETMEAAVGALLLAGGWRLALAESVTGGLIASRVVALAGASQWFAGGVVTYANDAKRSLLGLDPGPVVTLGAARAMAEGVRRLFGCDVALATTGVAGPDPAEGLPPGTVFAGLALPGEPAEALELRLSGDRVRVRQLATINALDALRRRLLGRGV